MRQMATKVSNGGQNLQSSETRVDSLLSVTFVSQNEGDLVEGHQGGEQHGVHRVGGAGPRDAGVRPAAAAQQDRLPREYRNTPPISPCRMLV